MSVWYDVNNRYEARCKLKKAFREKRLVSILCDGVEISALPIGKLLVDTVNVCNVIVRYDAIKAIAIHHKINITDIVARYLQRD